jgi:hypothetical protein
MESETSPRNAGTPVFDAMKAAEPTQAIAELSRLTELLHLQGIDRLDLDHAWDAFKRLLERRGYYVDTPARLKASLKEIDGIGAGFDLYDLARGLARYDAVRRKYRQPAGPRSLPDLKPFTPALARSTHGKEKPHA